MVLGFVLAYIMAETKNLVLPMLLHFTNNAFSFLISLVSKGTAAPTDASVLSETSAIGLGFFLFLCSVVPWLFLAGSRLLRTKAENAVKTSKRRVLIAAIISSAFCFVAGIGVTAAASASLVGDMQVLNLSFTEDASADSGPDTYPIIIEEDGTYQISYVITSSPGADGRTSLSLTDPDGKEYLGFSAASIFGNTEKYLQAGEYNLTYTYDYENTEPAPVNYNIIIMKLPG
jgi:hypothetical protein